MEESPYEALHSALSEHQRIHRQIPAQLLYGLPFGEFLVLKIIRQLSRLPGGEDKVTASQIHSLGGISKPGISQILNSLENKELIRREIDKRDRRAIAVSLTPKGESVIQDAHKIFSQVVRKISQELGADDTEQLARLLQRLNAIVSQLDYEELKREVFPPQEPKP